MKISNHAIEKPRLVILGSIIACLLGLAAALNLPKERTPRIQLPVIIVAVPNLGAPPPVNEAQIVRRIEDQTGALSDLRDEGGIRAQAVNGAGLVQFIFDDGVEVEQAKRDVESLINQVKGEFPPEAQTDPGPLVNDIAFEEWPIIQVFVAGGVDGEHRRAIAEDLQTQIEQIAGVSAVDIFGGLEQEVQIEVEPDVMALYGFSFDQLAQVIRAANAETATGNVEADTGADTRVRIRGKFESLDAMRELPLGVRNGTPVVLSDVAQVYMGHKPTKSIARYAQEDAVVLLARAKTDIDVMATAENIQQLVADYVASGKGESTRIGTVRSQAREIRYMLSQLGWSAIYGTLVVFILLWLFMGWRNAILIGTAVPFAVFATGGLMWLAKRTIAPDLALNNMTLFAMILVIGMVVDGCIIVGENIFRHRELGHTPLESAKRGIGEVGPSLMGAYLTTFAAFGPMYLVRGIMGDFMSVLPTVVVFALLSAMLVDHFLLPVLSMYFMKARVIPTAEQAAALADSERGLTIEEQEVVNAQTSAEATKLQRVYGRLLRTCIRHRIMVLCLSVMASLTPAWLFMSGALGVEFFPKSDIPIVEVYFELPLGSSMEDRSTKVAKVVEDAVYKAVRDEEWYRPTPESEPAAPVTTIGEAGALSIRLDNDSGQGPEFGTVYVELALAEDRTRHVEEIRQAIADAIPPMPGVQVRTKVPQEGPPAGSPILVRVFGSESSSLEELAERARQVEQLLLRHPATYDVSSDYHQRPELFIDPNDAVASLYELDPLAVKRTVNYALEGVLIGEVDFGSDEQIDLRLRTVPEKRDDIEDLHNLPLRSETGKLVTLGQVARIQPTRNANVINRYDKKRVINVHSQLHEGYLVEDVKLALLEGLQPEMTADDRDAMAYDREQTVLQAGPWGSIEFGGESEIRDDALVDLQIAMIVAMAAMMVILTLKFNSFVQPLIILFSVPVSLVGVAIGLMVCGFYFSVSAMIGIVALSGIVVNDAIVLVDFINRLHRHGVPLKDAVVYAGQLRIRPIFLTTITTIGGLMPLALNIAGGGEFWQPLTVTIMFGLLFATLLQLFVIPMATLILYRPGTGWLDPESHPALSGNPQTANSANSPV